jgi:hypothetical protein
MKTRLLDFLVFVVLISLGTIVDRLLIKFVPKGEELVAILIFGVNFAVVCEIFRYYFFHKLETERLVRAAIKQSIEPIIDRLVSVIEYHALFTRDRKLEGILYQLRDHSIGNVRWLIAKFISEKLNSDFRDIRIQSVYIQAYSELARRLIPECEKTIYLTLPFTPAKWVKEFFKGDRLDRLLRGDDMKSEDLPRHTQAILESKAQVKRRLIILEDGSTPRAAGSSGSAGSSEWAQLLDPANSAYFEAFTRLHEKNKVDTRYVELSVLSNYFRQLKIDFRRTDVSVFDDITMISWTPTAGPDSPGDLVLDVGPSQDLTELVRMFDFQSYPDLYKGTDEIRQMINSRRLGGGPP